MNKYHILKKCKKVLILPIVGYEYYINENGITHKKVRSEDEYYYVHAKNFTDSICERYPSLKKECDYFSNWVLLWTASRLADNSDSKKMRMYKPTMTAIRKNFKVFMCTSYFSKKDKLTYLLILIRIYRIAHILYLKMKKHVCV